MSSISKRSFSSNPVISWGRQPIEGVSLLETSPFGSFKAFHGQRWTDGSLADGPFPSTSTVTVTVILCGRRSTLFLSPYQLPPTPWFRRLWTDGFVESCRITILGLEKQENHWWTPHPEMHLILRTRVIHLLAPFLTKASLRLPCVFPSYIYSAPSSFFLHFIFADYWERQRERPSL